MTALIARRGGGRRCDTWGLRAARQRIRLQGGYLRALAQCVEVAEGEARIMGSKS